MMTIALRMRENRLNDEFHRIRERKEAIPLYGLGLLAFIFISSFVATVMLEKI